MKVYKYPIKILSLQDVEMPVGASILCCQMQGGEPMLWALVQPENKLSARGIRIVGTGHEASDLGRYIDTIQIDGGALIFHVFEQRAYAQP